MTPKTLQNFWDVYFVLKFILNFWLQINVQQLWYLLMVQHFFSDRVNLFNGRLVQVALVECCDLWNTLIPFPAVLCSPKVFSLFFVRTVFRLSLVFSNQSVHFLPWQICWTLFLYSSPVILSLKTNWPPLYTILFHVSV